MFESEEQIEKSTSLSGSFRFLIILLVIIAVGAGGVYLYLQQADRPLTQEEAAVIIKSILKAKGPAVVHFHAGVVQPSVDEKPKDPHYKLLEKAGYVKLSPALGGGVKVDVTPLGEGTFARFPELQKAKNLDGTLAYVVPLADRQLVAIEKVVTNTPSSATVTYTWKWAPNKVGEDFDAAGKLVQSFNTWDRATLISKYGVDFYHGEPSKTTVNLVKGPKGWEIAVE
ncbi:MAG: hypothetical protein ACE14L_12835 [Terriglobales bacterium]